MPSQMLTVMGNYKIILATLLLSCLFIQTVIGQEINNFEKGFQIGFKTGYCYNQNIGCIAPLTPMTPLVRLNESYTNYHDGYNRGFQVGLDLQRIEITYNTNLNDIKKTSYNQIHTYRSSEYVLPIDLQLLKNVLAYKQTLFDSRADWVQQKILDLKDLAQSILVPYLAANQNFDKYNSMIDSIDNFVKTLNSQPIDFTDNSIFNQITAYIKSTEKSIDVYYNSLKNE